MRGLIAIISKSDTYRQYERGLTTQKAVEVGIPLRELAKHVEANEIAAAIDIQLTSMVLNLNLKWSLNDYQLKILVEDLIEKYKNESLEDFMMCFKKLRMGEYGELTRLDAPIVFSAMKKYLDEKYQVIEVNLMKEKDEHYKTIVPENSERDWLTEWQNAVNQADGFKSVTQLTEEEINAEGKEKPKRHVYRYDESEAEIRLREAYEKLWEFQELTVRERHPDWTEEEIKHRLEELKNEILTKDAAPKHIFPAIAKIWEPKKKKKSA